MAEMSMVEKAARALANHVHQGGDYGMTGEDAYEDRREDYLAMARVAIEAMREPTLEMLEYGNDAARSVRVTGAGGMTIDACIRTKTQREAAVWGAMIDAVLNEEVAG